MKILWLLVAVVLALTVYSRIQPWPPTEQLVEESTSGGISAGELEWLLDVVEGLDPRDCETEIYRKTDADWDTMAITWSDGRSWIDPQPRYEGWDRPWSNADSALFYIEWEKYLPPSAFGRPAGKDKP